MHKKIVLSEPAYYDIDNIFSYISQDNKKAAEKLRLRIYESIKKLSDFPELGSALPEVDAPGAVRGYRRIVAGNYIVFYRVVEEHIVIARVLHTRQNWLNFLFEYTDD